MYYDFKKSELKVSCNISSIKTPRQTPSFIYITWEVGVIKGKSKTYHPNKGKIELNESFIFLTDKNQNACIKFQMFAKATMGEYFLYGETETTPMQTILNGTVDTTVATIETPEGNYQINLVFTVCKDNNIMDSNKDFTDEYRMKNTLSQYAELVGNIGPVIFKPFTPDSFWGEKGFIHLINEFRTMPHTEESVDKLQEFDKAISDMKIHIHFYSTIVTSALNMLMTQVPQYITSSGKIISYESNEDKAVLPLVAIRLMYAILDFYTFQTDNLFVEMPLIDLCGSMAAMVQDPDINDDWIIYITSVALLVKKFISQRYYNKITHVEDALQMVSQQAIVIYISRVVQLISKHYPEPIILKTAFKVKESAFSKSFIPKEIWTEIVNYLHMAADFYVTMSWIAESSSLNCRLEEYKNQFPSFDWPLLSSIEYINQNYKDFIKRKIPVSKLPVEFHGEWIKQILHKVSD